MTILSFHLTILVGRESVVHVASIAIFAHHRLHRSGADAWAHNLLFVVDSIHLEQPDNDPSVVERERDCRLGQHFRLMPYAFVTKHLLSSQS